MTREQLDQANADAIRASYRALADDPRNPPRQLLDQLRANAERWGLELPEYPSAGPPDAELTAWIEAHPDEFADWYRRQAGINGRADWAMPAASPPEPKTAAPRRTTTRSRARG